MQRLREEIEIMFSALAADRNDLEEAEKEYVKLLDAFDEFIERIQTRTDSTS